MPAKKFSISERIKSFKYAFRGILTLVREEHNSRIHTVVTLLVIVLGFILKISVYEWIAIIIAIALVFITELINSSIENIVNMIQPDKDPIAGKIKDMSAAAVLIASILAFIIGIIIFLPKIFN